MVVKELVARSPTPDIPRRILIFGAFSNSIKSKSGGKIEICCKSVENILINENSCVLRANNYFIKREGKGRKGGLLKRKLTSNIK